MDSLRPEDPRRVGHYVLIGRLGAGGMGEVFFGRSRAGRPVAGVAEALGAIHAAGLIHRDLKPSNILMAEDGPHVIDFGVARAIDASGVTSRPGTAGFMAPEVLLGRPLTSACDIFALGMVMAC